MISDAVREFTMAVHTLRDTYTNRTVRQPRAEKEDIPFFLTESYRTLIEDLQAAGMNPDDPTGCAPLVDEYETDLLELIEEYRRGIHTGLKEHEREEAPVRKPTVDMKLFAQKVSKTSEEVNEKGKGIIEHRTKEGYLRGVEFAQKSLRPYKIGVKFNLPYDKTVIEALQARSVSDFKGVLEEQGKQINRIVTDGALNGHTIQQIARDINQSVDKIGRVRATTIARTELMGSVNTAIRKRFASANITQMKRIETPDARICTDWTFNNAVIAGRTWKGCVSIAGKVFSMADAALIDANTHPNERGTWVPYIPGLSPPAEIT